MRISIGWKAAISTVAGVISFSVASAAQSLVLKNAFIESVKNRVTIEVNLNTDQILARPHRISSGGNDGDLHMAGRADEVGLPLVVEIMNAGAAAQRAAFDAAEAAAGGPPVPVSGIWRVWFEHPGGDQIQGEDVPVPTNTNPDHVFEIHPVTQFAGDSVLPSFVPIPGYTAYDAETAFSHYERLTATIQFADTATTIRSPKVGYNYAEFLIELAGDPVPSDDGGVLVLAQVLKDDEETVTAGPRRMVFAANTEPAQHVAGLHQGDRMRVLGIPRVNLERVSFLTAQHPGEAFDAPLPYEMIIVADFADQGASVSATRRLSASRRRPRRAGTSP